MKTEAQEDQASVATRSKLDAIVSLVAKMLAGSNVNFVLTVQMPIEGSPVVAAMTATNLAVSEALVLSDEGRAQLADFQPDGDTVHVH